MYRTVLPVRSRRTELASKIYLNLKTEVLDNILFFSLFLQNLRFDHLKEIIACEETKIVRRI